MRVYDVLMGYSDCLMATDEILRDILRAARIPEGDGHRRTALPDRKVLRGVGEKAGLKDVSVLAAAYRAGVPCYYVVARRLHHRNERGGVGSAR